LTPRDRRAGRLKGTGCQSPRGGSGGAGTEATDLVLVLKSRKTMDRAMKGKLTLGGHVAVAVGARGRDTEVATLKREVYAGCAAPACSSASRSRRPS
jgi:lipid-binding SYLF domain-containing protein